MKHQLPKHNEMSGQTIFVFECNYFDEQGNQNSSKKFTKEMTGAKAENLNHHVFWKAGARDLVVSNV